MKYKQNKLANVTRNTLKRTWTKAVLALIALLLPMGLAQPVFAAGDASFSFTTAGSTTVGGSFSVTVKETSTAGDNVNAVQANVSYPSAQLQYSSMSLGVFTLCGQQSQSTGSVAVGCAASSTYSGTQTVVTMNFTVIAAGSGQVHLTSGSDIDSNTGTSVWDGTLTSTTYTFSAPVQSGGGSTGGTTTSGGTKSGTSSGGTTTNKAPSTPSTSTTPTATTTGPTAVPATTTPTTTTAPATAAFTITVTDSSGKPVKGAKVSVDGQYSEYTNAQGKAGFSGMASGSHTVVVTASGKTTSTTKLTLSADETKQVALKLTGSSSPVMLIVLIVGALLVLGGAGFGYMKFLKPGLGASFPPTQGIVVGGGVANTPQQIRAPAPSSTTSGPSVSGPSANNTAPTQVISPTEHPAAPGASEDPSPKA